MSVTVFDYLKKIETVLAEIPTQTERIITQNSRRILDLNRQEQLFNKGEGSDGSKIIPLYAFSTVKKKAKDRLPFDHVTLFQDGDFYKGFDIELDLDRWLMFIFSSDSKTSLLERKYGNNIFGLNVENQNELNYLIIKPQLDEFLKRYL